MNEGVINNRTPNKFLITKLESSSRKSLRYPLYFNKRGQPCPTKRKKKCHPLTWAKFQQASPTILTDSFNKPSFVNKSCIARRNHPPLPQDYTLIAFKEGLSLANVPCDTITNEMNVQQSTYNMHIDQLMAAYNLDISEYTKPESLKALAYNYNNTSLDVLHKREAPLNINASPPTWLNNLSSDLKNNNLNQITRENAKNIEKTIQEIYKEIVKF